MINIPSRPRGRSPLVLMLGMGCLLLVGGSMAWRMGISRPNQQSSAVNNPAPTVETVANAGQTHTFLNTLYLWRVNLCTR